MLSFSLQISFIYLSNNVVCKLQEVSAVFVVLVLLEMVGKYSGYVMDTQMSYL